jgi:actin-related protein 2
MADTIPIILDLGTDSLKAGRSSFMLPEFVLPNTVGRPVHWNKSFSCHKLMDIMISDETTPVRDYCDLAPPVENGVVENWEDEKLILDYIFKTKLGIDPADHPVLIAEAPLTSLGNRKKMLQIFYEEFGFNEIQMSPQAPLVLYAQGILTGLVVDSGEGVTHVVPIVDDHVLQDLIGRTNIAGRGITERMAELLAMRGYSFHRTSDFDVLREIKEKQCFVSTDIEMDRRIASETTAYMVPYTLPDGRVIKVSDELFEVPEVLFQPYQPPYLLYQECCASSHHSGNRPAKMHYYCSLEPRDDRLAEKGLSDLIYDTVMKVDINLRRQFFESIVLSGGTTMFPGLSTRIVNDLKNLVLTNNLKGRKWELKDYKIIVEDPPYRRFLAYTGATVLANLSAGKSQAWANKREYDWDGVDIVIKRWQSIH